jgi:hypothetical protein
MARGLNVDDSLFCGANSNRSMTHPDSTLETI